MNFIRKTSDPLVANLTTTESGADVYLRVIKPIKAGHELMVYASDMVELSPPLLMTTSKEKQIEPGMMISHTAKATHSHNLYPDFLMHSYLRIYDIFSASADEGYKCEKCGKIFAYKYYRDKHLKYTRCVDNGDRKYPCKQCNR